VVLTDPAAPTDAPTPTDAPVPGLTEVPAVVSSVGAPPDVSCLPSAPGLPGGPPWPWPFTPSATGETTGDTEPPTAAAPSGAVGPTVAPPPRVAVPVDVPRGGPEPSRALVGEDVAALAPICDDQARGFAARFAADYLSWDEDAPQLRWQVLAAYFPDPAAAVLGWTGRGRQHVDLVIPNVVIRLGPQRVVVETTARIVLHERTGPPSRPDGTRDDLGAPPPGLQWAAASAPGTGSWRATATAWTRLHVPVGRGAQGGLQVQPRTVARHTRPGSVAS
jgi:hypothetical protein